MGNYQTREGEIYKIQMLDISTKKRMFVCEEDCGCEVYVRIQVEGGGRT